MNRTVLHGVRYVPLRPSTTPWVPCILGLTIAVEKLASPPGRLILLSYSGTSLFGWREFTDPQRTPVRQVAAPERRKFVWCNCHRGDIPPWSWAIVWYNIWQCRWMMILKWILKECSTRLISLVTDTSGGSYKCSSEPWDFIKYGWFIEQLSDCHGALHVRTRWEIRMDT
jgi:hypothetical protein